MASPNLPQMAEGKLTAQPLSSVPHFNWVFLVELIVCGILTLFFLFYFNRLFASLVSYGIRAYTWHYYRVYIDIHALQISLLGGRIFFKGFRYHGENETILVQSGYLTWKYWLRTVKSTDFSGSDRVTTDNSPDNRPKGSEQDSQDRDTTGQGTENGALLPSRIEIVLHGLEWFVYNRSAAYDSILSGFRARSSSAGGDNVKGDQDEKLSSPSATAGKVSTPVQSRTASGVHQPDQQKGPNYRQESFVYEEASGSEVDLEIPKILSLLPISVKCHKGAMVVGNEHAKSILTATFEKGFGKVDAARAGRFDIYKQIFDFDLSHPVIQLKPNPDFKQSQLSAGKLSGSTDDETNAHRRSAKLHGAYRRRRRDLWRGIQDLVPYFQSSVESFHADTRNPRSPRYPYPSSQDLPGERRWLGLTRYLDEEDQDEHEGWNAVEYGRFSTLVDCPSLRLKYYWDIPGKVLGQLVGSSASVLRVSNDINGAEPPEWGMYLVVRGGMINYGPWADRQRASLQAILFPNFYRDAEAATPLSRGQTRQSTKFKLAVDIEEETTIRIPTRESSKDWIWKGRAEAVKGASKLKKEKEKEHPRTKEAEQNSPGPDIRPFGWLALRVDGGSTINYEMDMFAATQGYRNQLELDLRGTKMSTSVNHGILWQSERQQILCDLSNPVEWRRQHCWSFDVHSDDLELFILRDHVFLLTDLVSDWTSGPFPEFYAFVPFQYNISLSFTRFRLFMNLNDSNIVNSPTDTDDNAFFIVKGKTLAADIGIPMMNYRPNRNEVTFRINLSDASLELSTPLWNTHHTFIEDPSVATLNDMELNGSYAYNTLTSPSLTDILTLDLCGSSPNMYFYGFLVRYILKIKDNYFGEDIHFKTLEEFQEMSKSDDPSSTHNGSNPSAKSNDLDVILHIHADDTKVLLPANIYDRLSSLVLEAASLDVDMRFTNYYMDLETFFSPISISLRSLTPNGTCPTTSETQLFIDGLRIFGHRLFGLPPTEPTYVCNWDFDIGRVVGECTPEFLRHSKAAVTFFGLLIDDEENALPDALPTVLHDVVLLRMKVDSIRIWAVTDQIAFLLSSSGLQLNFNDWAQTRHSERLNLKFQDIVLAAVDRESSLRQQDPAVYPVNTYAYFRTAVNLKMVERKTHFSANRDLQQGHVRMHDQRSHRTPWLLQDGGQGVSIGQHERLPKINPTAMPIPPMPAPLQAYPESDLASTSASTATSPRRVSTLHGRGSSSSQSYGYKNTIGINADYLSEKTESNSMPPTLIDRGNTTYVDRSASQVYTRENRRPVKELSQKKPKPLTTKPSSLWAMPNFHLNNIEPDTGDVPLISTSTKFDRPVDHSDDRINFFADPECEDATQTSFMLDFASGITGFCSPEAIQGFASLLDGLQAALPVEIIDNIQSKVISAILRHEKLLKKPKQILTICIQIPICRIRFLNPFSLTPHGHHGQKLQDRYDLELSDIRGLVRKTTKLKKEFVQPSQLALTIHLTAQNLLLSARAEEPSGAREKELFDCRIDELVFWSVAKEDARTRGEVNNIHAMVSKEFLENAGLLIERTSQVVKPIFETFEKISNAEKRRLHSLIYYLTKQGTETTDPLFLTRPSYVLRTADEHLRQNDSWKIVSRLRNIYKSLKGENLRSLILNCVANDIPCPQDCLLVVLSTFDNWRTWDLAHVRKSYVMRVIWDMPAQDCGDAAERKPNTVSLSVRSIHTSLDPGPNESAFLVEDLRTSLQFTPNDENVDNSARTSLTVQNRCSNAALRLRWELIELVGKSLKQFPRSPPQSAPHPPKTPGENDSKDALDLHLVFLIENSSVCLDGINLKLTFLGDNLKGSVTREHITSSTSVGISSDAGSTEVTSRSKGLMYWRAYSPNIFFSHTPTKVDSHIVHDWKLAAACRSLRYDIVEDPLGIIQVADRFVEDEIKHILAMIANLGPPNDHKSEQTTEGDQTVHKFHAATFLDDYQLCLTLLPSVVYLISGDIARLSVTPASSADLEVNFDIKQISHTLQSKADGRKRIVSSINFPPINGRVMLGLSHGRTTVDVDSTIETIRVDADSVRNILTAINGPEISHFVSDIQNDAMVLKDHFAEVIAQGKPEAPAKTATASSDLVYNVRLSLAGINIHSSAPSLRTENSFVDMDLAFGIIQIHLESGPKEGTPYEYPELDVNLSQVVFDLRKREKAQLQSFGNLALSARLSGTSTAGDNGEFIRSYHLSSRGLEIELSAETASMIIDITAHLQERYKTLDVSQEMKHLSKLRQSMPKAKKPIVKVPTIGTENSSDTGGLFDAMYSVDLANIQVSWLASTLALPDRDGEVEDLVFSLRRIELATKRDNAARLRIENMQLQMVPISENKQNRTQNSALLPEVVFNVAYLSAGNERRMAFQAAGKALDIRMTSDFILPASILQDSLALASERLREAQTQWVSSIPLEEKKKGMGPSIKQLTSLLIDADFAGGVVSLQRRNRRDTKPDAELHSPGANLGSGKAKYGQYGPPGAGTATLRAPGVAVKVQFENTAGKDPTLNAEIKVAASTNVLHPTVVPLITQISSSVKEVVGEPEEDDQAKPAEHLAEKALDIKAIGENDPTTILGRCKLNVGLKICKQEFTLSCQPIARVVATTSFEDSYITVNTVQSAEQRRFFAVLVAFEKLQASVKHVYSNESTANFDIDSIVVSMMNSKHVSSNSGISAILKISPTRLHVNAKQIQDILLFREIWMPLDDLSTSAKPKASSEEARAFAVQKYHQMASAGAFPWNSTLAIEELDIQLDLGQTLGKSDFNIRNLWLSSKKSSDWEQNLCVGFEVMSICSTGRLSGFVELSKLKVRTSIEWIDGEHAVEQAPLIQAAVGFGKLQSKVSFEYQPFLAVDINTFDFLMYNVRHTSGTQNDRLVSILEGDELRVYCTALAASQGLALYQTLQRLVQDKQAAYEASLKEIERFIRRKSSLNLPVLTEDMQQQQQQQQHEAKSDASEIRTPISLQTDVAVNLKEVKVGAFPSSFQDSQVFKLEALDAEARFSVAIEEGKLHSGLGLTLGQLRVALSNVTPFAETNVEELSVAEIVGRAAESRGGTILNVPRVVATMETWQIPTSNKIDYIFKSSFEGKVDVGWNYSRIAFIRGMWSTHSRALATRLGKPLPQAAVQITGGPEGEDGEYSGQEKITAVVNVPQSRYSYTPLEVPVIETPQLRDMGEATPPLEWIGLHRDKLPNITHQIVIVTLMEVAKDVEDAYSRILGSS